MVQRKVPNKLGIQADHVKSDKLLANLKPSPPKYQDGKNRGVDLKKKMKKTRSIKLSDIESLRSSPRRRHISQTGKPPPLGVPATAAIPQKQQPLIKASEGSPNYMKSTSCFDARKEQSQVSLRNTQTGFKSKNTSRRSSSNTKLGSASGNKPARALTRTSSLKLVRTLTKTPSFKPARASARKSSRVALCADMNAQRATCSSTLKDSKFPAYLMLSPGATESERTSVMKVCTYTYCSLNGHRHSPLPPLKCFLSARRRLLKIHKSIKIEALSPRGAKPSSVEAEGIVTPKLTFEGTPAHKEADFGNLDWPPLLQDVGRDFFIEIYAKSNDNSTKAMGEGTHGDKVEILDVARDVEGQIVTMSSVDWGDEAVGEYRDKQVEGTLSEGSAQSEDDFEENLEQCGSMTAAEINATESFPREQLEDGDEYFLPRFSQGKTTTETFYTGSDFEGEWDGSEVTDMEWEEGHLTESEQDSEADYSSMTDDESDFHNEYVIKSDDVVSSCNEVILADVLRDDEANCTTKTTDGALNDEQTHQTLQDDGDETEDREHATKDSNSSEQTDDDSFTDETQNNLSEGHSESSNVLEDQNLEKGQSKSNSFKNSSSKDDGSQTNTRINKFNSAEERVEVDKMELEDNTESDAEDASTIASGNTRPEMETTFFPGARESTQQPPNFCDNQKRTTRCKKRIKDEEESRNFNPREPNYLPLAPDPEAEKVDLRHQMMDERKNAEEWMLDYHLQQAVTQLAPARKRKVALLVQAFETVMPTSKYEPQLRNTTAFVHARPMQACS
ncbi:hypothetical protein I3843_14G007900 [Carya illinoinensis]|nr:hypothetical protein I3843_14G007900 [Carya illinoinensis]KAG7945822.1 hypothetical protein I3843_14G007900 [Carya illinoinensis]